MKKLILTLLLCAGCDYGTAPDGHKRTEVESYHINVINHIWYFKDERTGFCFATTGLLGNSATIANVSCTPEVEKLLFK